LQKIGLPKKRFAEEVGNYFAFCAIRSQNMLITLQEKINEQKKVQTKLKLELRKSKIKSVR
jgi:alpha-galactosidase